MQQFVWTRAQLAQRGIRGAVLKQRLRKGALRRVLPDIYCSRAPTTIDKCRAVALWRPDAVLSHFTALWLHGLAEEPTVIEAYVRELPTEPVPSWLRLRVPDTASTRTMRSRRMSANGRRILRRMPRMQVYLPEELYAQVKERRLPASELLQEAVRAELRRQELLANTADYLEELVAEVGAPSKQSRARAATIARRVADRRNQRAG